MPDTLLYFIIIFTIILVIAVIPLLPAIIKYELTKRFLKREFAKKLCSVCGIEYGSNISPILPGYDQSTPSHERTYEYWVFRCVNCSAEVWVNAKAQLVKVYSKAEIDKQWEEIKKRWEEYKSKCNRDEDNNEIVCALHKNHDENTENSLYRKEPDFEAMITVLSIDETGRKIPPHNGIRWDFRYAEDPKNTLFMIWPEFITDDDLLIPKDAALCGTYRARMYIVTDEMKEKVHDERMKEGTKFYSVEGPHIMARGIVTKILWKK